VEGNSLQCGVVQLLKEGTVVGDKGMVHLKERFIPESHKLRKGEMVIPHARRGSRTVAMTTEV